MRKYCVVVPRLARGISKQIYILMTVVRNVPNLCNMAAPLKGGHTEKMFFGSWISCQMCWRRLSIRHFEPGMFVESFQNQQDAQARNL